jgi:hypothetical protein
MRLLSRLLVIFVICLIAIALPAAPAQAACPPYDIELSPQSAPPGTEVTVHGYEFSEGRPIDIYYDGILVSEGAETDPSGDFTIVITIPEDCSGYYHVHADVGYAEADAYFQVKPGLTVSPGKGPLGTNVTVKGQGFAKNEEGIALMYYLNGSYKAIEGNIVANGRGSWETSFQIPASIRGEHKIDAQGDESWLWEVQETTFTVTGEISIGKSSGIVGDTITMNGIKFAANEKDISILFDSQAVVTDIKANSEGEWETSFQVPGMAAGEYIITAEGEQTKKEDIGGLSFEIKPDIVLSPDEGHVGMDLTVTGVGFAASEDLVILYDDSQLATAETDDKGNFEVSFSVPESQHGEHLVKAKPTGGTNGTADLEINASAAFTMESDPPPVPTFISPADRGRLGFMGEVAPTFEWSEVSDDSGVAYYRLQIATTADVTASGEFVDPIFSVTNLAETSHILTEALPYGTYYWIVQAVDGAENESGWTAAYSFRVGLLPRWGLIAAIAAAAVLLLLLIRALVIRRGIYYDRW